MPRLPRLPALALVVLSSIPLAACTAGVRTGPVEVTRFHAPATLGQLGQGTIFVESTPSEDGESLALAPYKSAIAAELVRLGYREAPRSEAAQIARVDVESYRKGAERRRSPVSVGVGGGTGSYGSGVGLGIGLNLGGAPRDMLGTTLALRISDAANGAALWEGRASIEVSDNSPLATSEANAAALARALLQEFPGTSGETTETRVSE